MGVQTVSQPFWQAGNRQTKWRENGGGSFFELNEFAGETARVVRPVGAERVQDGVPRVSRLFQLGPLGLKAIRSRAKDNMASG